MSPIKLWHAIKVLKTHPDYRDVKNENGGGVKYDNRISLRVCCKGRWAETFAFSRTAPGHNKGSVLALSIGQALLSVVCSSFLYFL